jgi:C4-dicarboxylate transporter, DctM subunit
MTSQVRLPCWGFWWCCLAGLPIAFALGLFGYFGIWSLRNMNAANTVTVNQIFDLAQTHTFTVLPLFILMGNLIARARISHDLYAASNAFLGHYRGGLAMATIAACGGFSAVSGSSMATASTMSRVAMPPMRRHGYSDALAAGSITAGGTLGILIPPSVILLIYGILTSTNIGHLFIAGIVPGDSGNHRLYGSHRHCHPAGPQGRPGRPACAMVGTLAPFARGLAHRCAVLAGAWWDLSGCLHTDRSRRHRRRRGTFLRRSCAAA